MNYVMDPLFDLCDDDEFAELLAREEIRRSRTGESLAVAVLDIDGLKAINAAHGDTAGTDVLTLCAEALQRTLRSSDQSARTGPDSFAVLLHATDSRSASVWADRFEDELEQLARDHPAAPITCAVGMADTDEAESLPEALVSAKRRMEVVQMMRKLRRTRDGET